MDTSARRAQLAFDDVDVVAIVPGANMQYFVGLDFHLSERPIIALIASGGEAVSFIIPELEVPQLARVPDLEARTFVWNDTEGFAGAFAAALRELGLAGGRLGVDEATMRVFESMAFQAADPSAQIRPVGARLRGVRAVKSPEEVAAMQAAIDRSQAALDKLLAWFTPGKTERQIAAQLDIFLGEAGCQGLAFGSLIQGGPNSALPHGGVTDRAVENGDFLLIDYGGRFDHYPADITRTFSVGAPTGEMRAIYDAVLRANRAALEAARPGVPCGEVDRAARAVIEAAGYGAYFIHRTGHGLGLEGHELPQIASGVADVLKPGMVFTIEPGIYVPGLGGVRIEDDVVVTDDGVRELTSYPRELRVL
jgi:Xaa-Pro dipeptidase